MDLVQTLLDVAATFVTPDWGALVGLIPVGLAILVILWFAFTIRRFAAAGPTRRAPARIQPIAPPGLHMPGPSAAPILVAFGAATLFGGLVIGGMAAMAGVVVLVLTLIVWFREAIRDYDHVEPIPSLPAVVHEPPPGIHMPGPSIRPLMAALGATALFGGLVIGGWVLVVAVLFLAYTLVGWLIDFTAEYRKVEEADRTGHLENIPPRRFPARLLQAFAVLFVIVALAQFGIFPPRSETAAGGPGGSPAPAASLPPGTLGLVAKNVAFDKKALEVPAGKPFAIQLQNEDAGVEHDVDLRDAAGAAVVQDQARVAGGKSVVYQYNALTAGTYTFICSVHPTSAMTGTLTVK